jgi:hypothetical protein
MHWHAEAPGPSLCQSSGIGCGWKGPIRPSRSSRRSASSSSYPALPARRPRCAAQQAGLLSRWHSCGVAAAREWRGTLHTAMPVAAGAADRGAPPHALGAFASEDVTTGDRRLEAASEDEVKGIGQLEVEGRGVLAVQVRELVPDGGEELEAARLQLRACPGLVHRRKPIVPWRAQDEVRVAAGRAAGACAGASRSRRGGAR